MIAHNPQRGTDFRPVDAVVIRHRKKWWTVVPTSQAGQDALPSVWRGTFAYDADDDGSLAAITMLGEAGLNFILVNEKGEAIRPTDAEIITP